VHRFLTAFHCVVAPFWSVGKPCPNSILEALAVGRPVLVSDFVDIGQLLQRAGAGLIFKRDAGSLCQAIEQMCQDYGSFQPKARLRAEFFYQEILRTLRTPRLCGEKLLLVAALPRCICGVKKDSESSPLKH
jgi:glycosyltransferase involved in cell wall biosynthesis